MTTLGNTAENPNAKGRPLIMLAVLLSTWVGFRLMMWESPLPVIPDVMAHANQTISGAGATQLTSINTEGSLLAEQSAWTNAAYVPPLEPFHPAYQPDRISSAPAGHQLVWMAAMSYLPVPDALEFVHEASISDPVSPTRPALVAEPETDRWSLDAWAFWRDGGSQSLNSAGRTPIYGASQAGAVLNYRLVLDSARDPRAYARVYRALIDNGETEIAAGLSARPLAALPIRAHAEVRVTEFETSTEVRPAAFVTTEFPRTGLPLGVYAEAYAQAGYVGGEISTPFADGQVHVMREVSSFDLGDLSLGGAVWAGAQEDAQRVDIGPSVRFDLRIGDVPARVSVDYRERVAGGAEPPSGVAVTLSSRF